MNKHRMMSLLSLLAFLGFAACSKETLESQKSQSQKKGDSNQVAGEYSTDVDAMSENRADTLNGGSGIQVGSMDSAMSGSPQTTSTIFKQESFDDIFISADSEATSTFSIDVDTASYTLTRQLINNQSIPVPEQVRTEEFINFFKYQYAQPEGEQPFAVSMEAMASPWKQSHQLLKIGIQGKNIDISSRPASNLVFLLDVSGSMSGANKLGLIKYGLTMISEQLTENDRIAIVVYAGAAGLVLDSTTGNETETIIGALEKLQAGGGTNGGEGIELAYKIASENKIEGGINRVILGTDGDFNIGRSTAEELDALIIEKAESGIELSVLGVGMGYMGDQKMESLANKGNGNYSYLDNQAEAKRVLTEELSGTLQTIAKDVKVQINFDPAKVASYKLIGYDNRRLENTDFEDDTKDAGELGAGHSVTALYELLLQDDINELDSETVTLQLRYKEPGSETSQLVEASNVLNQANTEDFTFINAVTAYALKLRNSADLADFTFDQIIELAGGADNPSLNEQRKEFIGLVEKTKALAQ